MKKKKHLLLIMLVILVSGISLSGCASINDTVGGIFAPVGVTMTYPENGATGVSTNIVVKASFNEAVNALSFNSRTFLLFGPSNKQVKGKVYYNPNSLTNYIATFTPLEPLKSNTTYRAVLTTGVTGNLKQHLSHNYSWKFTTGN